MKNDDISQLIKSGIRSVSASFPFMASVSQAWCEYESHIQQERVNAFFLDFASRLDKVENHLKEIKNSEQNKELVSLLERTIDSVRKETTEYKRSIFSLLLANCVVEYDALEIETKLELVDLLDRLSLTDIQLLRQFSHEGNLRVETLGNFFNAPWTEESDRKFGEIIFSLSKLEARGLISQTQDNIGGKIWERKQDHWINRWKFKHFEILPYGRLFLKLIGRNIAKT
ncbi:MAG: hypothetical protein OEL87_02290 [Nanoarchaeota archaeon]|nr:hypothetical protein [Nanoarchaeota archaeon]